MRIRRCGRMIRSRPQLAAYGMLVLVMLLWAGNTIVARAVRGEIPPLTLALLRWAGALLIVTPFALRHVIADCAAIVRSWAPLLLLGLLGVAAFNAFLYSGLRYTTASNGMLLQAAIPALVLVVDLAVFRVRPAQASVAGVLLSTLGVLVIVFRGELTALTGVAFNRGDALILCGVLSWAFYTSLLKLRPQMHALSFLWVTFAIGVLTMLPLAALEWREILQVEWRPEVIGAIAYVAVLPSVVAYALFNAAVASVGAAKSGQAITLMPLFGGFLAAATLGEPLHGYHFAGMALILVGIVVPLAAELVKARRRA
jgi:drug/metabolite transporter (DMT)-like permease